MSDLDRLTYWKRRARDAEWVNKLQEREIESTNRWAQKAFEEQRRLTDRLVFVYGVARACGITTEDLAGDES